MLEQVYEWFQNGGTALVTGGTALIGGIAAVTKTVGTFNTLKESLPQTVQDKVDSSMDLVTEKIETGKSAVEQLTLRKNILDAKAKLESSVLSDELKQEYLNEMIRNQEMLREKYGEIIEVPLSL